MAGSVLACEGHGVRGVQRGRPPGPGFSAAVVAPRAGGPPRHPARRPRRACASHCSWTRRPRRGRAQGRAALARGRTCRRAGCAAARPPVARPPPAQAAGSRRRAPPARRCHLLRRLRRRRRHHRPPRPHLLLRHRRRLQHLRTESAAQRSPPWLPAWRDPCPCPARCSSAVALSPHAPPPPAPPAIARLPAPPPRPWQSCPGTLCCQAASPAPGLARPPVPAGKDPQGLLPALARQQLWRYPRRGRAQGRSAIARGRTCRRAGCAAAPAPPVARPP
eukprot:scaffold66840_cov35-Phaeocystis_antarctica.AAC.1